MPRKKAPPAPRASKYTRRKESGAAGRKRRKTMKAKLASKLQAEVEQNMKAALEFAADKIGDLPLDDPMTALAWLRKAQLVALHQVLRDPGVSAHEKFRAVKEMSDAAGRTHSKALLEAEVKRLADKLKALEESRGAAKRVRGADVKRPPTARGMRRGPRALEVPPKQGPEPAADAPSAPAPTSPPRYGLSPLDLCDKCGAWGWDGVRCINCGAVPT